MRDAEGVVAKQAAEVEQLNAVIMEADKARRLATGAGCLSGWASDGAWCSAAARRAQHRAGRQPWLTNACTAGAAATARGGRRASAPCRNRTRRRRAGDGAPGAQERLRQRREVELVASERDLLGAQLVRRNDELALLYHKTRLQQAALAQARAADPRPKSTLLQARALACPRLVQGMWRHVAGPH